MIPENEIDFNNECERLNKIMDKYDCVNIFLSEGAGVKTIIDEKIKSGETIEKDAFGHVRLDELNPGKWFAKEFADKLNANKVLIQKSGYFSRSAKANKKDLELIFKCAEQAVVSATNQQSGVVGLDEDNNNELACIEFHRIKGEKPFDTKTPWYINMLDEIREI